jgi:hypothetical protein
MTVCSSEAFPVLQRASKLRHATNAVGGSSPAVASPPPVHETVRAGSFVRQRAGAISRPIAQTKPASSRATAATITIDRLPLDVSARCEPTVSSAPSRQISRTGRGARSTRNLFVVVSRGGCR